MTLISWSEEGAGRPVIMLHGFCETKEVWKTFTAPLSKKFNIIVPDLPGFGESAAPGEEFTLNQVAEKMLEWLTPWKQSFPVLIGHSLGGYVALAMARKEPEIFAGLGLFHSTAYADSDEKKEGRNKTIAFVEEHGVAAYAKTFVPGLFYDKESPHITEVYRMAVKTSATTLIDYALAMKERPSAVGFLMEFKRPVLFIAGEKDTIIPLEQIKQQSQLTTHGVFNVLSGCGHMGMLENPVEGRKAVEDFVISTLGAISNAD